MALQTLPPSVSRPKPPLLAPFQPQARLIFTPYVKYLPPTCHPIDNSGRKTYIHYDLPNKHIPCHPQAPSHSSTHTQKRKNSPRSHSHLRSPQKNPPMGLDLTYPTLSNTRYPNPTFTTYHKVIRAPLAVQSHKCV